MKNTQQAMVFFGKILAGMLYGGAAVCKTVSKDLVGPIPTLASFPAVAHRESIALIRRG